MGSVEKFDHLAPKNPNAAAILRAAEKRNPTAVANARKTPRLSKANEFQSWDADHGLRQKFRRLLDPGILRNNDKKDAIASLEVLKRMTENILKHPDNPDKRKFKITNDTINRHIMSRKGTVEFLQEMGFREKTDECSTMLVFNPDRMKDLCVGAKCLEEVFQNQVRAIEDAERASRQEIANRQAAVTKVRRKIYDDRLAVAARVEREKAAMEREPTQADGDDPEPPVDEMANLKIKTLSDYTTSSPQQ